MAEGGYEVKGSNMRLSVVNPFWEVINPKPDLQELFDELNKRCFNNALKYLVVIWCDNFTGQQARLAGKYELTLCKYKVRDEVVMIYGSIRLNKTLLKTKTRADLVQCLLRQMIHAYLFTTGESLLENAHGKAFQREMERINYMEGTNITIFKGTKRCDGDCKYMTPNYGYFAGKDFALWRHFHPIFCLGTLQELDLAKFTKVSPDRTELVPYYLSNPMNILNAQMLTYKVENNLVNLRSLTYYNRGN